VTYEATQCRRSKRFVPFHEIDAFVVRSENVSVDSEGETERIVPAVASAKAWRCSTRQVQEPSSV